MIADQPPRPPAIIAKGGISNGIPRMPRNCRVEYGHVTPWAKRHGFSMKTYWCPAAPKKDEL